MKTLFAVLCLLLPACAAPVKEGSCLPLDTRQAELCKQGSGCVPIHKDIFAHNLRIELESALHQGYEAGRAEACKGS